MVMIRRRARSMFDQDDLQSRLGDLGDIAPDLNLPMSGPPAPMNRGYDTTGTKDSSPGISSLFTGDVSQNIQNLTQITNNQGVDLQPYASLISTILQTLTDSILQKRNFLANSFSCTSASSVLLRNAENRGYLLIQNNSSSYMYIGVGYTPSSTTGLRLAPGSAWEPNKIPQESVEVIGGSVTSQSGVILYSAG